MKKQKENPKFQNGGKLLRMICLLLLLCIPLLEAGAQEKKVTLKCTNERLTNALKTIEKQSDYKIIFSYNELQAIQVNVSIQNATPLEAVRQLISGQSLDCSVDGRYIHIFRKKEDNKSTQISGQVIDEENEPLPGVNVRIKGTGSTGTLTDINGNFSLNVKAGEEVELAFSFIGKETVELRAVAGKKLKVKLMEKANAVDEVVVTGIYTRNKESFTGSSATFSSKDLKMVSNGNILGSLKTLDPSFAIVESNTMGSDPNQQLNIEIRGKTSIIGLTDEYETDPNQPLFILDGFESSLSVISDLSMDRVQSITILKDAAATAIYGSKAANGVVVVETKAPEPGKLQVSYTGNLGISFADLTDYNLMNSREKLEFEKLAGMYGTITDGYISNVSEELKYNMRLAEVARGVDTYWMSEPVRLAVNHRHNVFIEGGDGAMRYGVGVNYGKTEGVMKGSDRDVMNGNVRLIYRKGHMSFTNSLNIDYAKAAHEPVGFSEFSRANPYYRKYAENGEVNKELESFSYFDLSTFRLITEHIYSPMYNYSNNNLNTTSSFGFTNNFEADYRPIESLRIRAKFGFGKSNEQSLNFSSPFNKEYIETEITKRGEYTESNKQSMNYDADLSVTYGKLIAKKHQINAVGGMRITQTHYNQSGFTLLGFIDDEFRNPAFAQDYNIDRKSYSDVKRRTASYYINSGYSYANRYLFDFSWRADGASIFGSNKLFTNTWAVGLGWNIHNEAFMKHVKWIDFLKLRASIGNPGNQNFDAYISMKIYSYNNHHANPWGVSAIINSFGNNNLEWQKTLDRNIGLDLYVLDNRLRLNFDYFSKKTDPLLVYINLPSSTGSSNMPSNIGEQLTKGYTLLANYLILNKSQKRWSVNASLRHIRSRYQNVSQSLSQYNEANKSKNLVRYYDGGSPSDLWTVRSAGIDPITGREIFLRKDGTQTFTYDYDDEVVVGNSEPNAEGVIGTSFYYKGFSVSANLRYRLGGQIFLKTLYDKVENITITGVRYNQDKRALYDRWKQPGDIARFKAISTSTYTPISSRFIADENTLAGESISVGYETVETPKWLKAIGASSFNIRAYMNEIFRISTVKNERGIDYPFARSISLSMGLRF